MVSAPILRKMDEVTRIGLALIGPGTVGKALLEQLRVEVNRFRVHAG